MQRELWPPVDNQLQGWKRGWGRLVSQVQEGASEGPHGVWVTWTRAEGEGRPCSGGLHGGLCPFCVPAITNHHKLSGSKQHKIIR